MRSSELWNWSNEINWNFTAALKHNRTHWYIEQNLVIAFRWESERVPVGIVLSTELPTDYHHKGQHTVKRPLVCVEGRGRIYRSGLTQDIQMGSCVWQCHVPHQWIAQREVGPVFVYCDGVGCHVLCLWHGISVWQHIGQSLTATRRHRLDMTSDV